MAKMNTPNKLTVLRVILIPFFLLFLLWNNYNWFKIAAFLIFVIASLTDWLDGYLARKNHEVTNFGKLMDPLADKLLTFSAFLAFIDMGLVSSVPVMIILARELLVTSVRMIALESGGSVIAANIWGKVKTATQMVSIVLILLFCIFSSPVDLSGTGWQTIALHDITPALIWICAVITAISGATYIWGARDLLKD